MRNASHPYSEESWNLHTQTMDQRDLASSTASANQIKDTGQLAKVIGCDMEKMLGVYPRTVED